MKDMDMQIEALFKEYDTLREEMKMYLNFLRRDMHLTIIVLGVVAGVLRFSPSEFYPHVYTVIPSIIFILIMSLLMTFHMVSVEAKACARIEQSVNELIGLQKAMAWESIIAPQHVRNWTSATTLSTFGILMFFISVFYFSVFHVPTNGGNELSYLHELFYLHVIESVIVAVVFVRVLIFEFVQKTTMP